MAGEGDGGEGGFCLCCGKVDMTLGNDEDALIADRGEDRGDDGDTEGSVRDRTSMRFAIDFTGE